jgi:hypothetical protein
LPFEIISGLPVSLLFDHIANSPESKSISRLKMSLRGTSWPLSKAGTSIEPLKL